MAFFAGFGRVPTSLDAASGALGGSRGHVARGDQSIPRFWEPPCSSRCRPRNSQPFNRPEDVAEEFPGNSDLRHLENHLPGVAHDLRSDLDQLLAQGCKRPVPHRAAAQKNRRCGTEWACKAPARKENHRKRPTHHEHEPKWEIPVVIVTA